MKTRPSYLGALAASAFLLAACPPSPRPSPSLPAGPGPGASAAPSPSPSAATHAARRVLLEIDQMAGTPALELEREIQGRRVSLAEIYRPAGLNVEVHVDQRDLPRSEAVSLADLHAMMMAFRASSTPPDALRIHLLVVSKDRDDPDTLGIMFDFGEEDQDGLPREGFAVFADAHAGLGTDAANELLLTSAHELAHCFNLHHPDWDGQSFKTGSTVEGYSLTDTVRWELSAASLAHLGADPEHEVLPGRGSLAFGLVTPAHLARHKGTPHESFEVVAGDALRTARRGQRIAASQAVRVPRDRARIHAPDSRALKLRLEAPKRSYVVGEPIVLTVSLHNEGTQPQQVIPLLAPEQQFLALELQAPGATEFEAFRPAILRDARGVRARALQPGESLYAEAKVFFGSNGWTCKEPGRWRIRADFPAAGEGSAAFDEANGRIQSAPLEIEVLAPRTSPERRARDLILGHQQGMYLLLGGGDHLKTAASRLRALAAEAPNAAQAPAVSLALGKAALTPTLDPASKVRSQPKLDEARRYLQRTLDAELPPLAVAEAHEELARALQKAGLVQDAKQIRRNAIRKLRGKQEAASELQQMRREVER